MSKSAEYLILRRLDRIETILKSLIEGITNMAVNFEQIEADIVANRTATDAVIALLTSVAQQLRDLIATGTDPFIQAKIDGIALSIEQNTASLNNAVTSNTPVATPAA